MTPDPRNIILVQARLMAEVPIWIEILRYWSFDRVVKQAAESTEVISKHGLSLFTNPKDEAVFDAVARGIAALAFARPGGVDVLGLHFSVPAKPKISHSHLRRKRKFRRFLFSIDEEEKHGNDEEPTWIE